MDIQAVATIAMNLADTLLPYGFFLIGLSILSIIYSQGRRLQRVEQKLEALLQETASKTFQCQSTDQTQHEQEAQPPEK